jgi:hypothetical protein
MHPGVCHTVFVRTDYHKTNIYHSLLWLWLYIVAEYTHPAYRLQNSNLALIELETATSAVYCA